MRFADRQLGAISMTGTSHLDRFTNFVADLNEAHQHITLDHSKQKKLSELISGVAVDILDKFAY